MKKIGKLLLYAVLTIAVLLAVAISLTIGWRPIIGPKSRPLTARRFEATPQRLERGRYIATTLSGCTTGCHAPRRLTPQGASLQPGTEGSGQVMPIPGLPGRVVAPNLTPDVQTGAGSWTDDQLARAIREGIGHDGRALFPFMPYGNFRIMSDEDLASVILYLRSLPPVHNPLPSTEIIFPVKYLMRSAPQPVTEPVAAPDSSDRVKYGQYLVTLASCRECHTPSDKGQPVPGMEFAGGSLLEEGGLTAASANLTPDPSGISYYDEALFIQVMRTGYVRARKLSPLMPVDVYQKLTDDDLKAMFAYLRSLKPIKHRVDNSLPPTYCKLCRLKHGAGDQN
ncbi:MAG TPA: c-type cytochrome [Terriglobales bacterium]|jgi:mono/diheme cytochrome c family protein|nr:c-type cytochrome [Terriglobales bacterium]